MLVRRGPGSQECRQRSPRVYRTSWCLKPDICGGRTFGSRFAKGQNDTTRTDVAGLAQTLSVERRFRRSTRPPRVLNSSPNRAQPIRYPIDVSRGNHTRCQSGRVAARECRTRISYANVACPYQSYLPTCACRQIAFTSQRLQRALSGLGGNAPARTPSTSALARTLAAVVAGESTGTSRRVPGVSS